MFKYEVALVFFFVYNTSLIFLGSIVGFEQVNVFPNMTLLQNNFFEGTISFFANIDKKRFGT